MSLLAEEQCPVSLNLLGRLYRSSPEGLAVLVRTVPPQIRASLAFYCYRRAHLEGVGLTIASTCSEDELRKEAGMAGAELFTRAKAAAVTSDGHAPVPTRSRRGVTLASGALWCPPKLEAVSGSE